LKAQERSDEHVKSTKLNPNSLLRFESDEVDGCSKLTRSGLKNKKYFHPLGERFNIRKLLQTIKVKLFYFSTA